ncbi:MAG: molecular chaperone [Mogibacterium sp.]|nr:molecular chaperone [Mogibacterium sp.]
MKKKNVSKEERETILLFNEADDTATIYTFNSSLKRRLAAFAEKYPDLCALTVDDAVYGSVTYEIQKSRVSIRLVAPYSEERRKVASEYAKENGIAQRIT